MDDRDRACFGHTLELLADGRRVTWDGGHSGMTYVLAPDGRFERDGRVCRSFSPQRQLGGRQVTKRGDACRFGDGDWRLIDA